LRVTACSVRWASCRSPHAGGVTRRPWLLLACPQSARGGWLAARRPIRRPNQWSVLPPQQWEQTENKSSIALYAGGAAAALWLSATVVGVVNAIPLVSF
jgi:hypothetical protein